MVDYGKLAAEAKAMQDTANLASPRDERLEADPKVFFQRVTAQIGEEMNRANAELRKRGVGAIARNHLGGFEGVVFLTFGIGLLCKVELACDGRGDRIRAIISGPPSGLETARKEFPIGEEPLGFGRPRAEGAGLLNTGYSPEEIAQDIISGIVIGKFD